MGCLRATYLSAHSVRLVGALFSAVLLPALAGCTEDLASRGHYETPFSLWGVLSPDLDTQSVRVYLLEDFPTLDLPDPHGVAVHSTDLTTGERRTWQDSILVEPNGQRELVFSSPFRAEFGHTYRVEAVRLSDEATSYAEVWVPEPVTMRLKNPYVLRLKMLIEDTTIRVHSPRIRYTVTGASGAPRHTYTFDVSGKELQTGTGWEVPIDLVQVYDDILFDYNGRYKAAIPVCGPALYLLNIEIEVVIGDPAWDPPNGVFDPDVVSQPRTLSNVVNGFGFIGGGYALTQVVDSDEIPVAIGRSCFFSFQSGVDP